jgi:hypothetical protein
VVECCCAIIKSSCRGRPHRKAGCVLDQRHSTPAFSVREGISHMGSHSPEKHPENVAEVLQEIAHQAEQWVRRMGPKWKETHRRDMSWDDWIGLREAIESLYEDAYGQLLCPYPEGAKELKNLYDRTVAALKPSREHPGIGALSMIPIHSLINRCRSLAQGLEGPGESSGTTPVGRRAKAQQDAVATANSSTRSTSTFRPR